MKTKTLKNIFTDIEIKQIKNTINETLNKSNILEFEDQGHHNQQQYIQYAYLRQGRKDLYNVKFTKNIIDKVTLIANDLFEKDLFFCVAQYTEYAKSVKGNPTLGFHHDGGDVDFILDYQLESNCSWAIGIEEDIYEIEDNETIALRPVSYLHYRPEKIFDDNDYLKMIFFKFMEKDMSTYKSKSISEDKMININNIYKNYYKGN